ncbi:hypothetical protein TKK_0003189 [Trichogramma kaykai]
MTFFVEEEDLENNIIKTKLKKLVDHFLKKNPDIVNVIPGRLIDHLANAPNFTLNTIEVLILDEADRLAESVKKEKAIKKLLFGVQVEELHDNLTQPQ